jgi:hypothetical protein
MKLLNIIALLASTAMVVNAMPMNQGKPRCKQPCNSKDKMCGRDVFGNKVVIACISHCWTIV